MKKLNLKLDDLRVESFATAAAAVRPGTVLGHQPPVTYWTCPAVGCPAETEYCPVESAQCPSHYDTCLDTCWEGCHLSMNGGQEFTCEANCFSHYTDCHRCTLPGG